MTIEFLPYDVSPSSPMYYYQSDYEEIEKIFPLDADWIDRVWAASIDWSDGTIVPIANIPLQDILDAITNSGAGAFTAAFGVALGMWVQWRDDTTLFVPPGQVAHRGAFKRQGLDESTGLIRVIDAAASLRDPAADGGPGTSGLAANTWYSVYAKLDVASSYPEYRISKLAPTNGEGYGRECPSETGLAFLTVFKTGALPEAAIRPYDVDSNGRYFWREILVGPEDPGFNLNVVAGTPFPIDCSDHVPPVADRAFLTVVAGENDHVFIRTTDDATDPAGYHVRGANLTNLRESGTWLEIPINVIDDATGLPVTSTSFDLTSDSLTNRVAVVGFHVPRE